MSGFGHELGRHVGRQIMLLVLIVAVVSAITALGGYFGFSWLSQHISISWNPQPEPSING